MKVLLPKIVPIFQISRATRKADTGPCVASTWPNVCSSRAACVVVATNHLFTGVKSILDIVRHSIRRQVGGRRGRGSSSAGQLYFFFRAYPVGGCRTPGTQRSSCRNGGFGPRCKDGAHRGGMKKNFVESVCADYSDDLPLSSTPYSVVVPPLV